MRFLDYKHFVGSRLQFRVLRSSYAVTIVALCVAETTKRLSPKVGFLFDSINIVTVKSHSTDTSEKCRRGYDITR